MGAGFTGLSAARTLTKRGAKVAVLETHTIGWGASSRNGGMVLTGMKLGVETLAGRYGMDATKRMYAASLASIDLVEQIIEEEKIDCNFSRCGHLEVACKQSHFDTYARSVEVIAREFNHQLRIVPRNELRSEIGSDIYYGGMVDDVSAGLNPASYVAGLGRAALKAGACVFESTSVERIERGSHNGTTGFRLVTSRGQLFANDVFIATSGYTSSATPALRKKIIPIGSFIIATERLPDPLAHELSPRNRMIYDSKHYLYYYRLTPDNRILFGGRAAFFPGEPAIPSGAAQKSCAAGWSASILNCATPRWNTHGAGRWISASTLCPTPAAWTECTMRWGTRDTASRWPLIWAQRLRSRWRPIGRQIRLRGFHSPAHRWDLTTGTRGFSRLRRRATRSSTGSASILLSSPPGKLGAKSRADRY